MANAYVTQRFDLANNDTSYLPGAVIQNMAASQFSDFEMCGLVREATDDEVAAANAPLAPLLTELADDE